MTGYTKRLSFIWHLSVVRPSPDSDDYVEIACVAVVSYPRTREAREGMEREKEQKMYLPPPHAPVFLLLLPGSFRSLLPVAWQGNGCYAGYVEIVESAMIP